MGSDPPPQDGPAPSGQPSPFCTGPWGVPLGRRSFYNGKEDLYKVCLGGMGLAEPEVSNQKFVEMPWEAQFIESETKLPALGTTNTAYGVLWIGKRTQ